MRHFVFAVLVAIALQLASLLAGASQVATVPNQLAPAVVNAQGPAPADTQQPERARRCMTDGAMQRAFGFDRRTPPLKPVNVSIPSEGEFCKWLLQAVGEHTFKQIPFLRGWQFTATMTDGSVKVWYGDGQKRDVQGTTFRQLSGYDADFWVRNGENLLAHEFNFGWAQGRDPRYLSLNGNVTAPLFGNYRGDKCPENEVQAAALVGGSPDEWTPPDWSGGAWVFASQDPRYPYILLTASEVPGQNTWIDYWDSDAGAPAQLTGWDSLALSDASFHCHPAGEGVATQRAKVTPSRFHQPLLKH